MFIFYADFYSKKMTLQNLPIPSLILLITTVINYGVAFYIFLKTKKEKYKIIFFILIFLIASWNLTVFISDFYGLKNHQIAVYLNYLPLTCAAFSPSLFVLFSLYFPYSQKINKWLLFFILLPGAAFFIGSFTNWHFAPSSLKIEGYRVVYDAGPLYYFFIPVFILFTLISIIILISKRRRTQNQILKRQILLILIGLIITSLVGIITNAILTSLGFMQFYIFGTSCSVAFGLCTAYAVTRYRFMDINVVIRKSLIYSLLFILAFGLSLTLVILLYFILKNTFKIEQQISLLISMALLIIILPAWQKYLGKILNKYFNKELIDLSVKVEEFATSLSQAQKLDELISQVVAFISEKLKVEPLKIAVRDIRVPELKYVCQYPKEERIENLSEMPEFKEYFFKHDLAVLEELLYIKDIDTDEQEVVKRIRKFMEKNKAQAMSAIKYGENINGFMLFGKKMDNQNYSKGDIDFMETVTKQLSGVFDKVIFYEETVERVRREFGGKEI